MPFELASTYANKHLIVQPADLRLNPPESYLFIQDFLIISCGVIYAMCYGSYMKQTYKDKYLAGCVEYLAVMIPWEIYYAFTTTSTTFERVCFSVWFLMDISLATVALQCAYPPERRASLVKRIIFGVLAGIAFLHILCLYFPDDRQQMTAYWVGILQELPIGWASLYLLLKRRDTKGQSLEIWYVHLVDSPPTFKPSC